MALGAMIFAALKIPQGLDPHTLQALCISEHCPACSVAGNKPLPLQRQVY